MAPPRILVIHPGHAFSTADVFTGLCDGLRANGVHVIAFPLDHMLRVIGNLLDVAEAHGLIIPVESAIHKLSSAGIPGVAMYYQVDAVIAVTGTNLPASIPATLHRGGIPTALLCTESPYLTTTREQYDARYYRVVFTNERRAVPLFAQNAPGTVHYLPHAFNPSVHHPGPADTERASDVCFIGTAFDERRALFDGMDWTGIHRITRGALWDGAATTEQKLSRITPNAEAAAYYRSAAINVNHHRTSQEYGKNIHVAPDAVESIGPRAYELAACKVFSVCDDSRAELAEVFGGSVPTYRSGDSADLERVIRHYLARPDERERLAAAAYESVQPHTWHVRAAQVLDMLLTTATGRRALAA